MTKEQIIEKISELRMLNAQLGDEKNAILEPYKDARQPNKVLDEIEKKLDEFHQKMIDNNLEIRQLSEKLESMSKDE